MHADEAAELRHRLSRTLPEIPSKYLYDARGCELFDAILRTPEYYPGRAEARILEGEAAGIVAAVRPREVAEIGPGSGGKLRWFLDAMGSGRCTLFDSSRAFLARAEAELARAYPAIDVRVVEGDFLHDLGALGAGGRRLLLFLGGTVGNIAPEDLTPFLARVAELLAPDDAFLLGVDLVKDRGTLEAAYDDAAGLTAAFNRNVLAVVNRRFGADFDPEGFEHVALWDAGRAWIEMRLRATRAMEAHAVGLTLRLAPGDELRTEISCKYTRETLGAHAGAAGLRVERWLTDPEGLFALALTRRTR